MSWLRRHNGKPWNCYHSHYRLLLARRSLGLRVSHPIINLQPPRIPDITIIQGGEVTDLSEAGDPAEQELQLAVGGAGGVLGDLMAGEVDGDPGKAALGVRDAHVAGAGLQADGGGGDGLVLGLVDDLVDPGVVGHEELLRRRRREPLLAVPCHVVQRHESAVRQEEIVQKPAADDHVVGPLDHRRECGVAGWLREVAVRE